MLAVEVNNDYERELHRRLDAAIRFRYELEDAIRKPFMASVYNYHDRTPQVRETVNVPIAEYEAFRAVQALLSKSHNREDGF